MYIQIDNPVLTVDYLLRGGNIGALAAAFAIGMKVMKRLDRDETLRKDFPPHRHVDIKILYPKEYEPSEIGQIEANKEVRP